MKSRKSDIPQDPNMWEMVVHMMNILGIYLLCFILFFMLQIWSLIDIQFTFL